MAPWISPNKTVEGLVGGHAGGRAGRACSCTSPAWRRGTASCATRFWLGLVVAVAAPLGDLAESMLKRDLGIKDIGTLLPGHGGVLDRFDALLFVLPAAYYLARVLTSRLSAPLRGRRRADGATER